MGDGCSSEGSGRYRDGGCGSRTKISHRSGKVGAVDVGSFVWRGKVCSNGGVCVRVEGDDVAFGVLKGEGGVWVERGAYGCEREWRSSCHFGRA